MFFLHRFVLLTNIALPKAVMFTKDPFFSNEKNFSFKLKLSYAKFQ